MPLTRSTNGDWKPSFKAVTKPVDIAEPVHRVGPKGVSSGVSLRKYPKSSVQKVREICLHYVQKCSGKYEFNKTAARYVHQMADEVINQLASVASIIKKQDDQPEILQHLLDEWNENFPPSLGAMGTPKSIAALIERQKRELEELRVALETEKLKRERDLAGVLKSMDAQIKASRDGVMSERAHLNMIQKTQLEEFEKAVRDAEAISKAQQEAIKQAADEKVQRLKRDCENRLVEAQAAIEKTCKEIEQEKINSRKAVDDVRRLHAKEKEQLSRQIKDLEREVLEAQGAIVMPDTMNTDGSVATTPAHVVTLDIGNDEPEDSDLTSGGDTYDTINTPTTAALRRLQKHTGTGSSSKKSSKGEKKTLQLTGAVAEAVKTLKEKLAHLEAANKEYTKDVTQMSAELQETRSERLLYKTRMEQLEGINEHLRKALSLRVYGDDPSVSIRAAKTIATKPQPLSHTPDRLSHTRNFNLSSTP